MRLCGDPLLRALPVLRVVGGGGRALGACGGMAVAAVARAGDLPGLPEEQVHFCGSLPADGRSSAGCGTPLSGGAVPGPGGGGGDSGDALVLLDPALAVECVAGGGAGVQRLTGQGGREVEVEVDAAWEERLQVLMVRGGKGRWDSG